MVCGAPGYHGVIVLVTVRQETSRGSETVTIHRHKTEGTTVWAFKSNRQIVCLRIVKVDRFVVLLTQTVGIFLNIVFAWLLCVQWIACIYLI